MSCLDNRPCSARSLPMAAASMKVESKADSKVEPKELAGKKQVYTTTVETLLFSFSESEASMVYTLLSGPFWG